MKIVARDGTVIVGSYPTTGPWRSHRDYAVAIPRERLDHILVERARSLPVDVRERHRVTGLVKEGRDVTGVHVQDAEGRALELRARLVIGAAGLASAVAAALGLLRPHPLRRMALIQHVAGLHGFDERGEIFVDPPDYAILNPVAPGLVNLGLVVPLAHARPFAGRLETFFRARLRQLPRLASRLEGMKPVGSVQAMGPLAYRVKAPRAGGVMLVGDAAGFYDPFTGEGIFTALRSAQLLAEVAHAALDRRKLGAAALPPFPVARPESFRGKERLTPALQFVIARRRLANAPAPALPPRPALPDLPMAAPGAF